MLVEGPNAIGALLGDGWYRGRLGWAGDNRNIYDDRLALLAQLEIVYADGRMERIVTDESWRATRGPVIASDIYDGDQHIIADPAERNDTRTPHLRRHIPIVPKHVGQVFVHLIRPHQQRHLPVELGRDLTAVEAAGDHPAPATDLRQHHLVVDPLAGGVAAPRLQVQPFGLRDRRQVFDGAEIAAWAVQVLIVEVRVEQHAYLGRAAGRGDVGQQARIGIGD